MFVRSRVFFLFAFISCVLFLFGIEGESCSCQRGISIHFVNVCTHLEQQRRLEIERETEEGEKKKNDTRMEKSALD